MGILSVAFIAAAALTLGDQPENGGERSAGSVPTQAALDPARWGVYARLAGADQMDGKKAFRTWRYADGAIIETFRSSTYRITLAPDGKLTRTGKDRVWTGLLEPDGSVAWGTKPSFLDYASPDFRIAIEDGEVITQMITVKNGAVSWSGFKSKAPLRIVEAATSAPASPAVQPPLRAVAQAPAAAAAASASPVAAAPIGNRFFDKISNQAWIRLGTGGWDNYSVRFYAPTTAGGHTLSSLDEYGGVIDYATTSAGDTMMTMGKKTYPVVQMADQAIVQTASKRRTFYEIRNGRLIISAQLASGGGWVNDRSYTYMPLTENKSEGVFTRLVGFMWVREVGESYLTFTPNADHIYMEWRVDPSIGGMNGPIASDMIRHDPENPGWFSGYYSGWSFRPDSISRDANRHFEGPQIYQIVGDDRFIRYRSNSEREVYTLTGDRLKIRFEALEDGVWGPGKTDKPGVGFDFVRATPVQKQTLLAKVGQFRKNEADNAAQDRHMAFMNGLTNALNAANGVMAGQVAQSSASLNQTLDTMRMQAAQQQRAGGAKPFSPQSIQAGQRPAPAASAPKPTTPAPRPAGVQIASAAATPAKPTTSTAPKPAPTPTPAAPAKQTAAKSLRFMLGVLTGTVINGRNGTCISNIVTLPGPGNWGDRSGVTPETYRAVKAAIEPYRQTFTHLCSRHGSFTAGDIVLTMNEGSDGDQRVQNARDYLTSSSVEVRIN